MASNLALPHEGFYTKGAIAPYRYRTGYEPSIARAHEQHRP
ncbi:MAG TPA: hypothetical protein V6D34_07690 [Candidatus Sericytochromatia bacterium]